MLRVKLLSPYAKLPTCSNPGEDLGFDLYALEDFVVKVGRPNVVPTGIAAVFHDEETPDVKYGLLLHDRSSMASKGLKVAGGVIDNGYRGEIKVILNFISPENVATRITLTEYEIKAGDKIAQAIPTVVRTRVKIEAFDELPESERKDNGFGSTGR